MRDAVIVVSTLLEILQKAPCKFDPNTVRDDVSTLLEILQGPLKLVVYPNREIIVSTLLEILQTAQTSCSAPQKMLCFNPS